MSAPKFQPGDRVVRTDALEHGGVRPGQLCVVAACTSGVLLIEGGAPYTFDPRSFELEGNVRPAPRVTPTDTPTDPLKVQVSGDHYKGCAIQPVEYIHANGLPFIEGCVIKYVTRWRAKGGTKDLEKARHFLDMLINLETKKATP